jgi:hypothetical protein
LRKLACIILAVSLYAPDISRIAAYIECTVKANVYNVIQPCDCSMNNTPAQDQNSSPEKQNKFSEQTTWKYIVTKTELLKFYVDSKSKNYVDHSSQIIPSSFANDIFHPPRC